jgi:ATP-dependent helicase/nuclease subunit A
MSGPSTVRPLPTLKGEQLRASRPDAHVWLSASAGTGKTQVLAARVFRLLLRGVDPGAILCLTFTKAGAAEMATRISRQLAHWVRADETALFADLQALGEPGGPKQRDVARTLFAKVLDAPGGGLRIQTIHGFCQSLLAAFPIEAGLVPGFRPIEPREEALLRRQALADLLVDAEREGRDTPVATIGDLSVRLGEQGAEGFLAACARAGEALEALPSGIAPFVRGQLNVPLGDIDAHVRASCGDDAIDRIGIDAVARLNRDWGSARGVERAEAIGLWLSLSAEDRAAGLDRLHAVWAKKDGEPLSFARGWAPQEPEYRDLATRLHGWCGDLLALRVRAAYADRLGAALEVGRDYARGYAAAKRRAGAVDFDDLIRAAVDLLRQPGIGEWIRYKLDQVTEHVLVDEAQDTNVAQWTIVRALVDEYFVGRGVYAPSVRTLFTVGDLKQAIFGFQGTDPVFFQAAEEHFARAAAQVAGDDLMPEDERGLPFDRLSLTDSFRSTAPILEFVDAAIETVGAPNLGADAIPPHASRVEGPGAVELWPPVVAGQTEGEDAGEEGWIEDAVRENATRIARQVKRWLDAKEHGGLWLGAKGRALRPEDVMILVKRRGELAQLLVARLYAEGVPVAGVDRLRLAAPLAVQDLLAAVRFVLQPDDDLSLASLLVSPLIGWTQDELMTRAVPRKGPLWRHLLRTCPDRLAPLRDMLANANFDTPYRFLELILSGPLDGRRKLLARLGEEARDPIEELLNAALDFETTTTPSLQRFLDWFERDEVEIVRDAAAPLDAVRVMTAHGAKGLQAPLVILADATVDPDQSPRSVLMWTPEGMSDAVPVFRPRRAERAGAIDAALAEAEVRERQEHWRLFYVAATRAEERLVIAGALGPRANGVPPVNSWYAAAARTFDALGVAAHEGMRCFDGRTPAAARPTEAKATDAATVVASLPDWVRRQAPAEQRPPRPLAPSSLGEDAVADAPPTPAMRAAAERGRWMHALFERLPPLAPAQRRGAAERWLAARGVEDADAVIAPVMAVLDDPALAALFGPDALAEAPISATLPDGRVIAGTVDRLLIGDGVVRVIDYKTGRQVPTSPTEVPPYHLTQMAAYRAALSVIFPDATIEVALLYTAAPRLIVLDDAILDAAKPRFVTTEQSLGNDG